MMKLSAAIFLLATGAMAQQTDWVAQVRNKPFLDVREYAFTAQRPGGSISVGSNTITVVCWKGMNASNASTLGYRVYLSGGTGTAESVAVTGGTCTSAARSGTIIVTAANTHSGAWTVGPANGGINEALLAIGPTGGTFIENTDTRGGTVFVPCGTYSAYSGVTVQSNVTLVGAGQCSIVKAMVTGMQEGGTLGNGVISAAVDSNAVIIRDIAVNMNSKGSTVGVNVVSSSGGVYSNINVIGGTILTNGIGFLMTARAGHANATFNSVYHLHVENGPATCLELYGQTNDAGVTWAAATLNVFQDVRCTSADIGHTNLPVIYLVEYSDTNWFRDIDLGSGSNTGFQIGGGTNTPAGRVIGNIVIDNLTCENGGAGNCLVLGFSDNITVNRVTTTGAAPLFTTADATNYTISEVLSPSWAGYVSSRPFQIGLSGFPTALATPGIARTLANGANQNITVGNSSVLRVSGPSAGFSLGGFVAGVDGQVLQIFNAVAQQMTITNEAGGSTAANRIKTLTGADVVLRAGISYASFIYSSTDSRWILTATN